MAGVFQLPVYFDLKGFANLARVHYRTVCMSIVQYQGDKTQPPGPFLYFPLDDPFYMPVVLIPDIDTELSRLLLLEITA